jgi:hypothetical protein
MIRKFFRLIFAPHLDDDVGRYVHSGVGYERVDYDTWNGTKPRIKHSGVGYMGVYDE